MVKRQAPSRQFLTHKMLLAGDAHQAPLRELRGIDRKWKGREKVRERRRDGKGQEKDEGTLGVRRGQKGKVRREEKIVLVLPPYLTHH